MTSDDLRTATHRHALSPDTTPALSPDTTPVTDVDLMIRLRPEAGLQVRGYLAPGTLSAANDL